jgi:hypothetical protein
MEHKRPALPPASPYAPAPYRPKAAVQNPCSAVRATHYFFILTVHYCMYGGVNLEQDNSESVITTIFCSREFWLLQNSDDSSATILGHVNRELKILSLL